MTSLGAATIASALGALGPRASADAPFGTRTTYRVGGAAAIGFAAQNVDDLRVVISVARTHDLEWMVAGRGSNLLVADDGYDGIVVWLEGDFSGIESSKENHLVVAGASVRLPVLARRCASVGLSGLEWAVGVPGTVGGAIVMNAGGHGSDVASCLHHAEVLRAAEPLVGEVVTMTPAELALGYRTSVLSATDVVLGAAFNVTERDRRATLAELDAIVQWRRANQPGGQNAGSVFKNPSHGGLSAAELIDRAELKGRRVGGAAVSEVHANFIVADQGATAADVAALIVEVGATVEAASGIRLEPEVRLVGFGLT